MESQCFWVSEKLTDVLAGSLSLSLRTLRMAGLRHFRPAVSRSQSFQAFQVKGSACLLLRDG